MSKDCWLCRLSHVMATEAEGYHFSETVRHNAFTSISL